MLGDGNDIHTAQELLGQKDVTMIMIFLRVLSRSGQGVTSSLNEVEQAASQGPLAC